MGIDGQQLQWLIGGYTHLLLKLRYLLINYAENLFFCTFLLSKNGSSDGDDNTELPWWCQGCTPTHAHIKIKANFHCLHSCSTRFYVRIKKYFLSFVKLVHQNKCVIALVQCYNQSQLFPWRRSSKLCLLTKAFAHTCVCS